MNDGGPMFPTEWVNDGDQINQAPNGAILPPGGRVMLSGASLRDYFAGKALPAAFAEEMRQLEINGWDDGWRERIAAVSYQMANAMLAERSKQ